MKNKNLFSYFLAGIFCVFISLSAWAESPPSEVTKGVKKTIDKLIAIVSDSEFKNDKPSRRAAMHQVVDAKFDYSEMSKRSLGKNWGNLTTKETALHQFANRAIVRQISSLLRLNTPNKFWSTKILFVLNNGVDRQSNLYQR